MSILEFSRFQERCIELLQVAPDSHARHCFRSALLHLKKAAAISVVDPGMAAFRAITAEEEAASGLMRILQDLKYPAADKLNPRDHTHKHAVFPFICIIGLFFNECKDWIPEGRLRLLDRGGQARLVIELLLPDGVSGVSDMPLHFSASDHDTGELLSFDSQIRRFEGSLRAASVRTFLKAEANRRNTILYASSTGVPNVVFDGDDFILERKRRVIVMLYAYLMIFPYSAHQDFVSHSLDEFVKLLDKLRRRSSRQTGSE